MEIWFFTLITGIAIGFGIGLFYATYIRDNIKIYPYTFYCDKCTLKVGGTSSEGIEAAAKDHMAMFHAS